MSEPMMKPHPEPSPAAHPPGWEPIWARPEVEIPKRFASFSAPNSTIVAWADTLPAGGLLLDVGCGVGRHSVYLGGRGFRVAGIDNAPSGVARAIAACAERAIAFDGRVGDMAALPWPDATFDAAFSTSTIHHHLRADIVRAIDEIWRTLRPGGRVLLDFPDTNTIDYAETRALIGPDGYQEPEPNTFIDPRPHTRDLDGYLPHHFCDEADLRDLMRRFTILKLWEAIHPAKPSRGPGMVGKWVVWGQKPG
jgi:SAM-dependent methyltransferase